MNRFSERAREALETAQGIVRRAPGNQLGTEHLLIGVLSLPGGVVEQVFSLLGVDKGTAMARANHYLQTAGAGRVGGPAGGDQLYLTPRAKAALDIAGQKAQAMGDAFVGTEHLLLGILLEGDGPGGATLRDLGITEEGILKALQQIRASGVDYEGQATGESMLGKYSRDLTELARDGKLDPVIGRDEEIERVIQVLSRRTKNNPVAHRRAGRGQDGHRRGPGPAHRRRRRPGAAARQARARARPRRHGRRYQVPRRVRGAAQGRAGRDPAQQGRSSSSSTNCTPWSAPARPRAPWTPATCSSRRWRAASCSASARPRWTSTASTSRRTRRSSGASSPSWSASRRSRRRSRSSRACATATRRTTRSRSPTRRSRAAAVLSDRYIADRFLPDKAIDLLDEAGQRVRIEATMLPPDLREMERRAAGAHPRGRGRRRGAGLRARRAAASEQTDKIQATFVTAKEAWLADKGIAEVTVDGDDIAGIVSSAGPASRSRSMKEERRSSCSRWRSGCTSGVIGQDEAVEAVSEAVRRARAGLKDPKRPIGSLHLPRPDGRGQDRARQGAGRVPVRRRDRDGPHRHERVHGEAHRQPPRRRAARLRRLRGGRPAHRGGPPAAVQRGAVRRDREGAPGRLQHAAAGAGRRPADRRQGPHRRLQEHRHHHDQQRRRRAHPRRRDHGEGLRRRRGRLLGALRQTFRPEFLNRIDEIIVFHGLGRAELEQIVDLLLAHVRRLVEGQGMRLEVSEEAREVRGGRGVRPAVRSAAAQARHPAAHREPAVA